ncbi:replication factor A protein 3 [Amylostereum chailletii]|nr:replication factor A protein 3 [Amylostereum chailletii]
MAEHVSTRVNSAMLGQYLKGTVRIVGKVLQVSGDAALVEASDGGQVKVVGTMINELPSPGTCVDIVGTVVDPSTIRYLLCTDMGTELDLKLVDDVIQLSHDPRFKTRVFA